MGYLWVFLAALAVDTVPVLAPPAWMMALPLIIGFKLNPYAAAGIAAFGSTIGRWVLSLYIPRVTGKVFDAKANDNIAYLGRKLGARAWPAFWFSLAYSVTPLSTTALFTAAGVAKVNMAPILPAFFLGKFASDALMFVVGRKAVRSFSDVLAGQSDPKAIAGTLLGVGFIALMMFVDWKRLLQHRQLEFDFHVLKRPSRRARRAPGRRLGRRRWVFGRKRGLMRRIRGLARR